MTLGQVKHIEQFQELIDEQLEHEHMRRADELLTLTFCTNYDIDWYPLLTRLIGNW
jgi:hypothetical protein